MVSSRTPNPEPRTPRRRRRRPAISIIEVLFAIMVTTVGLFSAIAIFPFASAQARRARLNDMMAAAGRSAFHSFDARGMRRPDMLLAWDQATALFKPVFGAPPVSIANRQTAESFCIDPRMMAAHTITITVPVTGSTTQTLGLPVGGMRHIQTFPYAEPYVDQNGNCKWDNGEAFDDRVITGWNGDGIHDPVQDDNCLATNPAGAVFDTSLMRRVTLPMRGTNLVPASNAALAMLLPQADTIFLVDDDLAYDRPADDKSFPARQQPLPSHPLLPPLANASFKRQTEGKISWIATLVPQFDISGAQSDQYLLSIVMIYERTDLFPDKLKERAVEGLLQSDGATGGEITLTASDPEQLKLRPNDWVMLTGTYVYDAGPPPKPLSRFQWYRVSDCDPEPIQINATPQQFALNATLTGQDWNTSFTMPPGSANYTVRVTIVAGAFAVFEKTIRLEYGSAF